MTQPRKPDPSKPDPHNPAPHNPAPSRRDRTRPAEILGLAAVFALFVGAGVMFSSREFVLALEFTGATFVVSIVVLATLLLAISKPEPPEGDESDRSGH
ncbi:MAG: hypothetical protein ABIR17_07895 [Pseudolysinimonas sp.]|uniref:hypothetical protein n=1 Tax=Pseudolysinimonas sp. TaxID=2680009 RepID=UPI003263E106